MLGIFTLIHNAQVSVREAFVRRFDIFHEGGKPVGLYLRLPFSPLSLWLEWREQSLGFGHERASATDWTFFAGRVQAVLSIEPVAVQG